ncbi:MAG TPA: hypothetical protein DDW67_09155 [Elusimicrobia bacterium]|nr:hypothetical protein [Elusimicrobiota bacterium]
MTALLAVFLLAWAPAAYAEDNGTEFGIEDDLTVLGTEGTAVDPDVEVKGFSVFGSTQASYLIPVEAGNVVLNGEVQVSSGLYAAGSSTFTSRVEVQGYGVLKSTVQFMGNTGAVTNLYFDNGAANAGKVLKASGNGFLTWENDNTGLASLGDSYYLQMVDAAGTGLVNSLFLQNAGGTAVTLMNSSMTVQGAFQSDGAAKLGSTLDLTGAATLSDALTVQGATLLNGNVGLGNAVGDLVTVNGQTSFVAGSTFTAGAYFTGVSSFSNVADVHYGGGASGQVLTKAVAGGMQWSNVSDMVSGDNLGNHIATTTLQMANNEIMNAGHITASSATLTETLDVAGAVDFDTTLNVDGNATLRGNNQLGDAISDAHAINQAPEANVALAVKGTATSGQYITKFYSDTSLAAWIKKK